MDIKHLQVVSFRVMVVLSRPEGLTTEGTEDTEVRIKASLIGGGFFARDSRRLRRAILVLRSRYALPRLEPQRRRSVALHIRSYRF